MPGRVNKMHFKHIYSTFQSISVQTHQSLLLIDFNFAKKSENTQTDPHWLLLLLLAASKDSMGENGSHLGKYACLLCVIMRKHTRLALLHFGEIYLFALCHFEDTHPSCFTSFWEV